MQRIAEFFRSFLLLELPIAVPADLQSLLVGPASP